MIDTITLRLTESQFRILDHNKFSPNCYNFFYPPYSKLGSRGYIEAFQNGNRKEMLTGNYKPQLTLRKRWRTHQALIYLYIQFSAPKILFGNNFDELMNQDLEVVLEELKQKLAEMSVITNIQELKKAVVTKIHYGKNIVLPDFVIPHMIIGEIRKINFNLQNDLSEKDYRNSGHSLRFHNNEFELIFYDKKKDLQKAKQSDKKAIERDNAIQLDIFDVLKPKKPFEILRIEARFNTVGKIASLFKIPKTELTIGNLFDEAKSGAILSNYWKDIMKNYQLLACQIDDKEKFLAAFMANNPNVKLTNALATYAYIEFIKEIGVNRFRNLIEKKYSRKTWYNLKSTIQNFNLDSEIPKQFEAISKVLGNYKPLRLSDYQESIEF